MPIYEYHCDSCDRNFETIQRISDPPLESCDQCGSPVRKLLSAPAFQFKGSGWYVTDYADKKTKSSDSSSSDSDKGQKADAGKSDSGSGKKESTKKSSSGESKSSGASSSA